LFTFVTHLSLHFLCFLCSLVFLLKETVCTLSSNASHSHTRSTISTVKEQPVVITDVSRSLPLVDRLDKWKVRRFLKRNSITEGDVLLLEVGTTACNDTGDL
jgi:hypothetical protein